ncbi:hypothetical protein WJX82_011159 [Trebouxia sp. C0006]
MTLQQSYIQQPCRWGCAQAQSRAVPRRRHVLTSAKPIGQKGDAWKKQLATVTGVKYKPGPQQEDLWEDSTGVYDTDGNQLSLEDISDDDDDDDDAWVDDFGDDTGVLEDKEIFNMDTGWSIQDFEGIVQQPSERQEAAQEPDEDTAELGMAANSILQSIPPHVLKALEQQQVEANAVNAESKVKRKKKKTANAPATVGSMRIITGSAAGRRLVSPPGEGTRPMMEKVRGAVFSMVASMAGSQPLLPPGSRWLDLFAGTGAVGLEALSRGCQECHFIEMDPAVARDSLARNIAECGVVSQATVHAMRAEEYLKQARNGNGFVSGKAFDFISVCPPYEKVSYEELYDLLEGSPLIHYESIVIVEYAKRLSDVIRDTIGPLHKIRNKRYGRTYVAVYGPTD